MKKKAPHDIVVFHSGDLPSMATHCPQEDCGFSLYKGVLVQWDEDEDARILSFIDSLDTPTRANLLVAQEHEAALGLRWKGAVPEAFDVDQEVEVEGDVWHVSTSIGCGDA